MVFINTTIFLKISISDLDSFCWVWFQPCAGILQNWICCDSVGIGLHEGLLGHVADGGLMPLGLASLRTCMNAIVVVMHLDLRFCYRKHLQLILWIVESGLEMWIVRGLLTLLSILYCTAMCVGIRVCFVLLCQPNPSIDVNGLISLLQVSYHWI